MAGMIPDTVTIEGVTLPLPRAREAWRQQLEGKGTPAWRKEILSFLLAFTGSAETVELSTSGTTGRPAVITARKEHLWASARLTLKYLGLAPGDKALLCLPVRYIAGKMMIVRALAGKLDLYPVRPASAPAVDREYDFAAMTPMQADNVLHSPEGREKLSRIRILLLGGGPLSRGLEEELSALTTDIRHTYGMTETFSHIAMRKITEPGRSSWFTPLPGVQISLSPAGTLEVYAPHLSGETLPTHDLAVTAPGGRFRITGRSDNIINTGGIKVSPEGIEDLLQERIPWPFFVTGLPDPSLGEKITLIVRKERLDEEDLTTVRRAVQKIRPPTHRPRKMIAVPGFIYTGNEKLQRSQSRELAMKEGTVYDL